MSDVQLERTEIQVPIDNGHLIGNTLRQFAMRGVNSWQVAAYRISGKDGSFGLSGGYSFSYLELLRGKLVSHNVNTTVTEKLCKFELSGSDYTCDGDVIKNLGKLGVPSMDVCLVYASGSRSAEQNYAVAKRLCPQDVDEFVIVPSRHTPTIKFRYEVLPYDQSHETLVIEATPGVVSLAKDSAVKSLGGLHI